MQDEPTLIDYSSIPEIPLNSSSNALEFSLSLFPEPKKPLSLLAQAKLATKAWATLPETDRPPWREQAERELVALHAGTGITVKPKLIEARAANLYEVSLREKAQKVRED